MQRAIRQVDLDTGKEIQIWESAAHVEVAGVAKASNVGKCAKGNRVSAGGFKWEYVDVQSNIPEIPENIQTAEEFYKSRTPERTSETNTEKGTIKTTVLSDFEPKTDIEWAELHKVDLEKYKIGIYWTKQTTGGKFFTSLQCVLRKLGDDVEPVEIEKAIEAAWKGKLTPIEYPKLKSTNNKAIVFCIADEHVACSNDKALYDNLWNESEYRKRKTQVIDVLAAETIKHGEFEKIIILSLGDDMDGWNAQTTRGGHSLPQNMTNREAIEAYLKVNISIWDALMKHFSSSQFECYNVSFSNHGGNSFDDAANIALKAYLDGRYPDQVDFRLCEKSIESFRYNNHNIHYTHGKDDKLMRAPMPLNLDHKTEAYIKQYMDLNGYHHAEDEQNYFIKGDIHQFNWNSGKFFHYINCPSVMGSTDWIMRNFGLSKPGILHLILDGTTTKFEPGLTYFK